MLTLRNAPFELFEKLEQQLSHAERVPAAEVRETDSAYTISLELPGVERTAIDVKATERSLVISAERKAPEAPTAATGDPGQAQPLISEFRYGTWSRSFRFPRGIHRDGLKAHYRDGVLQVTAPKAEGAGAVTVTVGD